MKNDRIYFQGAFSPNRTVLKKAFSSNRYFSERSKIFRKEIEKVDALPGRNQKIKALRAIAGNKVLMSWANSGELMMLYRGFRDQGAFQDMINMYGKAENEDFKRAQTVREMLGGAYNKVKRPDKAIRIAQMLFAEGRETGEVYQILGRARLLQSDSAESGNEKRTFLEESAAFYEEGFSRFFEFYPGIQAVHRHIELGNLEKAAKMAKLVSLACKRDGAKETSDFRCMSARLEAACILRDQKEIDKTMRQIVKSDAPKWILADSIRSLSRVNVHFKSDETAAVVDSLRLLITGKEPPLPPADNSKEESVLHALHSKSYTYRGAGSSFRGSMTIDGNFKYGGQLPAHSISRKDLEFFDALLNRSIGELFPPEDMPEGLFSSFSFNEINNPDTFMNMADKFIRYHFGTNNFLDTGLHLEDNAAVENSSYDKCVSALIHLSGKDRSSEDDSKTNISAMFALGLGDCRHHAQVKQIMFDCWQKKKMNHALSLAMKALEQSDEKSYDKAVGMFYDVYNYELRTIDVKVQAPVKMEKPYMPKKDGSGRFIADKTSTVEEHTLSVLLQRDHHGVLKKVGLRDAFYQNHYSWGHADIDISQIEVKNGKFIMPAGEIPGEKINTGKSAPVTLTPTDYAGKRDTAARDCTGETVRLMGLPVSELSSPEKFLNVLHHREEMKQELKNMMEYFEKKDAPVSENVSKGTEKPVKETPKPKKAPENLKKTVPLPVVRKLFAFQKELGK
jgi:hypothetical protein